MKLNCCERCQVYWTCETKWYRGEKQEENVCCDHCDYYHECLVLVKRKKTRFSTSNRKKKAI